jgi:FtsP/CotA-like multicopper oxidase with cupredoxin domain
VTLHNGLTNNGTGLHFHGIRQNFTNQNDGVPSITQCPSAPGESITYTWKATQYGTTWYHSHFALQAWEGVLGGIVINGPATANYDEDLGHVFLNDWSKFDESTVVSAIWQPLFLKDNFSRPRMLKSIDCAVTTACKIFSVFPRGRQNFISIQALNLINSFLTCHLGHETADSLYSAAQTSGPPTLENGLINGTNTFDGAGSRFTTTFVAGNTYRIRLVNGAIDTHWKFMIDSHNMTVIAMDLVPIVPYNTTVLSIGIGQRYDILVTADQTSGDFWMRSLPQTDCSTNSNSDDIKGIVRYDSTSTSDPTTSAYTYTDNCEDEAMTDLVPYLSLDASAAALTNDEPVTLGRSNGVFKWYMAATTFSVEWDNPTLLQIYNGNTTFDTATHVVEIPTANEWMYFIIETTNTVPHPIHLHGHDFFVLAQGSGTYDSTTTTLTTSNPPRRDVAMLPSAGHLVIAFPADNPGAWLMHCHIGWHTSEGLALQLVERETEIAALIDYDTLNSTCAAWDTYVAADSVVEDDSGV